MNKLCLANCNNQMTLTSTQIKTLAIQLLRLAKVHFILLFSYYTVPYLIKNPLYTYTSEIPDP